MGIPSLTTLSRPLAISAVALVYAFAAGAEEAADPVPVFCGGGLSLFFAFIGAPRFP